MILFERILNYYKIKTLKSIDYLRYMGVTIGENCSIKKPSIGGEPFLITIGNHVQITDNVHFFTHGGGWVFRKEIPDMDFFGKIVIKDNVYIGSGAYIMPGITIESDVIVGARSVVTKSVPPGVIVAGNPAKIIGTLDDYKQKIIPFNMKTKGLNLDEKIKKIKNAPESMFVKKKYL
jgi:acetyltransferase-like isoleucine patch superfamily enzyme